MPKITILSADHPKTIPVPGLVKNKLLDPITVKYVKNNKETKEFSIQSGKHSDGATIPKIFWFFIGDPFNPKFARAAWFHDYMCKKGCDNQEVSEVFYRLLVSDGVNRVKAKLMKWAVLIFMTIYYKFV